MNKWGINAYDARLTSSAFYFLGSIIVVCFNGLFLREHILVFAFSDGQIDSPRTYL